MPRGADWTGRKLTGAEHNELALLVIPDEGRVPKLAARNHQLAQRAVEVAHGFTNDL